MIQIRKSERIEMIQIHKSERIEMIQRIGRAKV